jgi:hypothetical protein
LDQAGEVFLLAAQVLLLSDSIRGVYRLDPQKVVDLGVLSCHVSVKSQRFAQCLAHVACLRLAHDFRVPRLRPLALTLDERRDQGGVILEIGVQRGW